MTRPPSPMPRGGITGIVAMAAVLVALLVFGPWIWTEIIVPMLAFLGLT